jgi:hypothetical protein
MERHPGEGRPCSCGSTDLGDLRREVEYVPGLLAYDDQDIRLVVGQPGAVVGSASLLRAVPVESTNCHEMSPTWKPFASGRLLRLRKV